MVNNSKFVSVGVRSLTEINAPRGCAVILYGICQLADQNHAPSLTDVRLEYEGRQVKIVWVK